MWEIWANQLLPKALKSCQKSNKSPNLVTLPLTKNKQTAHSTAGPCTKPLSFSQLPMRVFQIYFRVKYNFLGCCVPCPKVSNRDQLFEFLNQRFSMACTAFKRPTKKLGMHGLFILGLGFDPIQNISSVKPLLVLCALIG